MYLSHAHFAAVKRELKRQQRKLYQAAQWRGYIAKNARAPQQVLMITKKTALFCLMQSMHGTAVPERRVSRVTERIDLKWRKMKNESIKSI